MDLTPLEQRLVDSVQVGRAVELAPGEPLRHQDMASWGPEREVRAEVIRDILLGRLIRGIDPRGLRLHGARVVGPLDLEGVISPVRLFLTHCDLPDRIGMRGARLALVCLDGCRVTLLNAADLQVEGPLLLRRGFVATQSVRLLAAKVGGTLNLDGAMLRSADGAALLADHLEVGGALDLGLGFSADGRGEGGAIRLNDARVGAMLRGRRTRVVNPDGPAIRAERLQVEGAIALTEGAELSGVDPTGVVQLTGARVGAFVSMDGARLTNAGSGPALSASYVNVVGTVYLDGGLRADGGIRLAGGRIGGKLQLDRAWAAGHDHPALELARLHVEQALIIRDTVLTAEHSPRGVVSLGGARVGGQLTFSRTTVTADSGYAVSATGAVVGGPLQLGLTFDGNCGLNLRNASVGQLRDDAAALPRGAPLVLDGLTYIGLPGGTGAPSDLDRRRSWLRQMQSYAAQPYRQLAAAYQAAGHEAEARRILIAQQEHLRDSGLLTGWSRVRHRLLGVTLGYGYQSWRALVALLGTLLLAVALFGLLSTASARPASASQPGSRCSAVERVGLAIDVTVPLLGGGGRERCDLTTGTDAGQALLAASWGIQLTGWALATLLVAGYTGLVRRG
jgi:hypothetical protein